MKSHQIGTRMSKEHIEIIAELARASHMTFAAMLRRLVLERLEQICSTPKGLSLPQTKGEPNENAQSPQGSH